MRIDLHPSLILGAGALLVPLLGRRGGVAVAVLAPLAAAAAVWGIPDGATSAFSLLGLDLVPLRLDALGRAFALAFCLYAALAGLYASSEPRRAVRAFGLLLAAGGTGVPLAGDFVSLLFFWELLAVSSAAIVACSDRKESNPAALRYFLLHAAGGACLLAGTLLRGDVALGRVALDGAAGWLVLAALCMNAAMPPLHAWLPDAYPAASPAGTVYLAAFTTKGAVAALARTFPGEEVLVWAGVGMALYGVVFAVLENDIRRLLAYHIVSQVGYMVCGVGLGTALALDGSSAHAFCHVFYKGLLLMGAGALLAVTGRSKLSELGGLAGRYRLLLALVLVGAASISGVPLFSGFASKSMIVSAADLAGRPAVELLLVVASMGTFLHTGLKLPYFAFFGKRPAGELPTPPVPAGMSVAMIVSAALCVVLGVAPGLLYALLPSAGSGYRPYTADHLLGALQVLAATALGFWLLRGMLGGEATRTRDADALYRPAARAIVAGMLAALDAGRRLREGAAELALRGRWKVRGRAMGLAPQVAVVAAAFAVLALAMHWARGNGR